jgi:hypothetical protein
MPLLLESKLHFTEPCFTCFITNMGLITIIKILLKAVSFYILK